MVLKRRLHGPEYSQLQVQVAFEKHIHMIHICTYTRNYTDRHTHVFTAI